MEGREKTGLLTEIGERPVKNGLKTNPKKSKWQSIQALLDNTEEMEEGNAWDWMDNHNTFDPTGRFITIDVSGLEESVKRSGYYPLDGY